MQRIVGGFLDCAILTTLLALVVLVVSPARAAEPNYFDKQYAALATKYSIEIVLTEPEFPLDGRLYGRPADRADFETYWPLFAAEWKFYPVEFVRESGLRKIFFCEDLASLGQPVAGVGGGGEHGDHLYLDVGKSRWTKMYTRALIHHEFFHVLDRRMHIKAGNRYGFEDQKWEALNAPGFKYGFIPPDAKGNPFDVTIDRTIKGFLNNYSKKDVAEDKADLYAFMIIMGQAVDERAKGDPVIKAKIVRMKELLKEFSPHADEEFWKAARKVTRLGSG